MIFTILLNKRLIFCIKDSTREIKWLKSQAHWIASFLLAWNITNGWAYLLLALSYIFNWAIARYIAGGYLAFLWLPCTPEKIVTIPIAVFFDKIIFRRRKTS